MNNNVFDNHAFDCLDSNIKKAFISLNENMKNKSSEEKIATIISFVQSLPKGITLTQDEKRAMVNVLMENMSERERKQMSMLLQMVGL